MNLNPIKLSIVLIIIFVLRLNDYITFMFNDFGIPAIRFQELFFFLLPGFYIISKNIRKGFLKSYGFFSALLFFLFFFSLEFFYHENNLADIWADLPQKIFYLILSFYFLINAGNKYIWFTLKTFVIISLINILIFYANLFGLFSFIEFIEIKAEGGRVLSNLNINTINDRNVIILLIAVFLKKYEIYHINIFHLKVSIFLIFLFCTPLTFFGASRGSIVLTIIIMTIYFSNSIKFRNVIYYFPVVLFIFLFFDLVLKNLLQINLFSRLFETTDTVQQEGRLLQIIATFQNFINNPILGVGYKDAARNVYVGITRSNFQYTQILASGGVLLFIVYFNMIFKFFGSKIKILFKNKILFSCIIFVLVLFLFRRPDMYLAIIAYMAYCERKSSYA